MRRTARRHTGQGCNRCSSPRRTSRIAFSILQCSLHMGYRRRCSYLPGNSWRGSPYIISRAHWRTCQGCSRCSSLRMLCRMPFAHQQCSCRTACSWVCWSLAGSNWRGSHCKPPLTHWHTCLVSNPRRMTVLGAQAGPVCMQCIQCRSLLNTYLPHTWSTLALRSRGTCLVGSLGMFLMMQIPRHFHRCCTRQLHKQFRGSYSILCCRSLACSTPQGSLCN